MHFGFTDAQEALRATARDLLAGAASPAAVRRVMESPTGIDTDLWRAMGEHGLVGRRDFVEVAIVAEELGATLACVPHLSSAVLAAAVLGEAPAGVATVAFVDDRGLWDETEAGARVTASPSGDGWSLDGHASFVLDGTAADVLVVAAGAGLYVVAAGAPGMVRSPLPTVDRTRRLARVELSGTPARRLGAEGDGPVTLGRALDLAAVALAAEAVGGARRCLDLALDHVRARTQFGRPLSGFQAVQHALADVLVDVESARAAAYAAAWAAASSPDGLPAAASMAKSCCSEAFARAAAVALHLHGALGFTWDHDVHLWFKRARSSRLLLGDPAFHRERLAERTGLPPARR